MVVSKCRRWLGIGSLLLAAGCATAGPSVGDSTSRNADVITRDEIVTRSFTDAYDAVRTLRPSWLRVQPSNSFSSQVNEVVVYMDDVRYGGPDSLRSIPVETLDRLERVNAMTATQRWGTGHSGGVIVVETRSGG